VTVSELFGAGLSGPATNGPEPALNGNALNAVPNGHTAAPVEEKKKRRKRSKKKKDSVTMNVWGSQAPATTSFDNLQREDGQRVQQQKRRRAEELHRQQLEKAQKAQTMQKMAKSQRAQQRPNVWASGGISASLGATAKVKSRGPKAAANGSKMKSKPTPKAAPKSVPKAVSKPVSKPAPKPMAKPGQVPKAKALKKKASSPRNKKVVNGTYPVNGQKVKKVKAKGPSGKKKSHVHNRNIEAVNKVSQELQQWLRAELKQLNPEVEANAVAHLLLTLDDDTARTTAVHTFGSSQEVTTFIDSFLMHRSHDIQQQKHGKGGKGLKGGGGKKKKNGKRR